MAKRVEHRRSFKAIAEDGTRHIIEVYVTVLDAGTLENPHGTVDGLKTLRTRNGQSVNRLDKGRYQIVSTREILTSDDPEAE